MKRFTARPGQRRTANGTTVQCYVIDDNDFKHDALLYITGDFYEQEEARVYAEMLAERLNQGEPDERTQQE